MVMVTAMVMAVVMVMVSISDFVRHVILQPEETQSLHQSSGTTL